MVQLEPNTNIQFYFQCLPLYINVFASSGNPSSSPGPVVKRFLSLASKPLRSKNAKRNNMKVEKRTRRVYIGWKHQDKTGSYKIVPIHKGGGTQVLDLDKTLTYENMTKQICGCFFPDGYSRCQNMYLDGVHYYVGTYTGAPISVDANFTFGRFMAEQHTYPIRLYLHTETPKVNLYCLLKARVPDFFTFYICLWDTKISWSSNKQRVEKCILREVFGFELPIYVQQILSPQKSGIRLSDFFSGFHEYNRYCGLNQEVVNNIFENVINISVRMLWAIFEILFLIC